MTTTGMVITGGRVVGDRIDAVGAAAGRPADRRVDADGLLVAPGFIDLQVNGGGGVDLTADPDQVHVVGATLARHGVTSYLPTVITAEPGAVGRARAALADAGPPPPGAAHPVGLHLEGPFLNPEQRGTHPLRHLRLPDTTDREAWIGDAAGVRLVTLAPELDGAAALIDELVAAGVAVSLGHSAPSLAEVTDAVDRGARLVTHLFNAMPPLHHRYPGLVGAALSDPRLRASLIVDGIHVAPAVVAMVWRLLGPERLVLVSDAVAALGRPPGRFRLGEVDLVVVDGSVRNPDGGLAGSVLSLDVAVANLSAWAGAPAHAAVASATSTPAAVIGLTDRGRVAPDTRADLVLLTPELEVVDTIVAGVARSDLDQPSTRKEA